MKPEFPKIISFIKTLQGLKELERFRGQFFWKDYPQRDRYDSVADHTWRMAMFLITLEPYLSHPIDFSKAMKMLLIHDIPEIIAGDLSPLGSDGTGKDAHLYNKKAAEDKFKNEDAAVKKIFFQLPKEQGQELYDLWIEFEKQEAFEAKVVKAIDKLEGKLQAAEYRKGEFFEKHLDFSLKYGEAAMEADPIFKEVHELVKAELTDNYKEFKPNVVK